MDDIKAKQQIVEKIKEASKILVTVSDDPSVDALSAAIGLAMLLDKQQKYATALFSGHTPPAIAFLEPEKTFDDTTDSLRDFIIALNKEKADHLRYKVEGDSVKIFITPYKTTITQEDLIFSQGDYNVELVIALGVDSQDNLDKSLEHHGQILHDATVVTMTAGDQTSTLGGIDWHDADSSSLSEMVAGLVEALKDDKKTSLLDEPIATALLTGIVAETDRFSNERTSSKVMTVAATLMAAGADQQLIATELQKDHEIIVSEDNTPSTTVETQGASSKDGLSIDHSGETLAELESRVKGKDAAVEQGELDAATDSAKEVAASHAESVVAAATPTSVYALDPSEEVQGEPTFGGTLSATTEQAAETARAEAENDQNKTMLSHAYLSEAPAAPQSAYALPEEAAPAASEPVAAEPVAATPAAEVPSLAVGGQRIIQPLSGPAIDPPTPALAPAPAPSPADLGLPLPPPLPDFSQGPVGALPPALPLPPTGEQPALLGDILAPEAPPTPDATPAPIEEPAPAIMLSAITPEPAFVPAVPAPALAPAPVAVGAAPNPGQFQIPGQSY